MDLKMVIKIIVILLILAVMIQILIVLTKPFFRIVNEKQCSWYALLAKSNPFIRFKNAIESFGGFFYGGGGIYVLSCNLGINIIKKGYYPDSLYKKITIVKDFSGIKKEIEKLKDKDFKDLKENPKLAKLYLAYLLAYLIWKTYHEYAFDSNADFDIIAYRINCLDLKNLMNALVNE